MRMAARKLLQHDGTNMVGGTAAEMRDFPRALVGLSARLFSDTFTSRVSEQFDEHHCSTAKKGCLWVERQTIPKGANPSE